MCNLPRLQNWQPGSLQRTAGWRKAALLACAALSFFPFQAAKGAAVGEVDGDRPRVTAIRYWSLSGVTRIAVESNGEFHFRADKVGNFPHGNGVARRDIERGKTGRSAG